MTITDSPLLIVDTAAMARIRTDAISSGFVGVRIDPESAVQLGSRTWAAIVEALPRNLRVRARRQGSHYQRFVETVIWVAWVDLRWANLPPRCGRWQSVHSRFLRWNRRRVWDVVALHIGDEAASHLLRLADEARRRPRVPLRRTAVVRPERTTPTRGTSPGLPSDE